MASPRVVSELTQATSGDRLHIVFDDGNDVEVVIEEMEYQPAKVAPDGYTISGDLYVSLVETDEVEEAFGIDYNIAGLLGIYGTEHAPDDWGDLSVGFEDATDDYRHRELGRVAEWERVD